MRISDWSSDVCSSDLAFQAIVDAIIDVTVTYLSGQIEQGVEAVQLFDSWAGSLSPAQFERWVIAPNAEIVKRLKVLHPDTPVIGFPKRAAGKLDAYADEPGCDGNGLEETGDAAWAPVAMSRNRGEPGTHTRLRHVP